MSDYFKSGSWNAACAVCGFVYKADQLKERWDGVKVCHKDWEPRHVLDFFKVPPDQSLTVPWSQPDDGEGDLTTTTVLGGTAQSPVIGATLTASLTDVVFKYTGTTGTFSRIQFPPADDALFKNISVTYVISVDEDSDIYVVMHLTGASGSQLMGLSRVSVGETGRFRNIPSQATWIREP